MKFSFLIFVLPTVDNDGFESRSRHKPNTLAATSSKKQAMDEIEKSESGAPIYRYTESQESQFTPATGDGENIDIISDHIETHVGPIESVFHEIVSDQVHIDIHWVKPTSKNPFHVLVTSGMSDKPMNVPAEVEAPRHLELCILLPSDWKIEENAFSDENIYWPVRWLKTIARFPHSFNTWVGYGHTIQMEKMQTHLPNRLISVV